jgi:hypothetical protein
MWPYPSRKALCRSDSGKHAQRIGRDAARVFTLATRCGGEMNYQISNTATARKEKVYIQVSQGDGNYRYDEELNEYVIDPLGDYILRILATDEFVPVVKLKASTRLRLDPALYFKQTGKAS